MIGQLVGWALAKFSPAAAARGRQPATSTLARASIAHTVIRACPTCSAPGLYCSEPRIRDGWPGSYVPRGNAREGQPVGGICPNCGALRPASLTEDRGVVWRGHL